MNCNSEVLLLKVWFVTGCEEEKKETWWLQSVTCDNGGISRVLYKNRRKKDIVCPHSSIRLPISSAVFRYHSIVLM